MISGKRIVVVLPAYHAAKTLVQTVTEIPKDVVDELLLVDDASHDETVAVARQLNLKTFVHERNLGYGANQKTCYSEAIKLGADIVVMLHPDYQYSPRLVGAMVHMVASGHYDVVLGSRILAQNAMDGGMPGYKYVANRILTFLQNALMGQKLSEYHTGYRAFTRQVLETLPLKTYSDDFIFDNQMLCGAIAAGFRIGEISCPTRYFPEASSINLRRSIQYGLGVLRCAWQHRRWRNRTASRQGAAVDLRQTFV